MECACQDEDGNVQEHALWALRLYFRNAQCKKVIPESFLKTDFLINREEVSRGSSGMVD